jgi:leucyl-tRNA synthetase
MIHCEDCGTIPVPEDQLPVELPKLEGGWLRDKGGNPLEDVPEWVNIKCPRYGETLCNPSTKMGAGRDRAICPDTNTR